MATRQEWAKRIADWRASGQSRDEYAAAHGLRPATLQWWVSALARKEGKPSKRSRVQFARVVAPQAATPTDAPHAAASALEVVLGGGRTVRVSRGFDRDLLRAVVQTLEAS
jgi:hypothetical protein